MSEAQLSSAIVSALQQVPGVVCVIRINSGLVSVRGARMRLAPKGTPDLCVLVSHGKTCWLEVKLEGGTISNDQAAWHGRAQRNGHRVFVVRSVKEAIECVTGRWVFE